MLRQRCLTQGALCTAKLVIIASNCPAVKKSEIEYYVMLSKTGLYHYTGSARPALCHALRVQRFLCSWQPLSLVCSAAQIRSPSRCYSQILKRRFDASGGHGLHANLTATEVAGTKDVLAHLPQAGRSDLSFPSAYILRTWTSLP